MFRLVSYFALFVWVLFADMCCRGYGDLGHGGECIQRAGGESREPDHFTIEG